MHPINRSNRHPTDRTIGQPIPIPHMPVVPTVCVETRLVELEVSTVRELDCPRKGKIIKETEAKGRFPETSTALVRVLDYSASGLGGGLGGGLRGLGVGGRGGFADIFGGLADAREEVLGGVFGEILGGVFGRLANTVGRLPCSVFRDTLGSIFGGLEDSLGGIFGGTLNGGVPGGFGGSGFAGGGSGDNHDEVGWRSKFILEQMSKRYYSW